MKYNRLLFIVFVLISLGIISCFDEVENPVAVLEDITTQDVAVLSPPPDHVFEGTMAEFRERREELWKQVYTNTGPEEWRAEFKKELEEQKLKGTPIEEFSLLPLQRAFYTKYIDADGIAIIAPEGVDDEFMLLAREAILVMTSKRPELRERLRKSYYNVLVPDDFTRTGAKAWWKLPELVGNIPTSIAGSCISSMGPTMPHVVGFCFSKLNSWQLSNGLNLKTFIHEFAHALDFEIQRLDPDFRAKLLKAYESDPEGFYCKKPCPSGFFSVAEYWAYAVTEWFLHIGPYRRNKSLEDFRKAHPMLTELMLEWLPRMSLQFVSIKYGEFDENLETLGTHF